jgi:hypothetical protein
LLASAQFRQANFSAAAETSLKFLKIEPTNARVIAFFARALAAADRKSAADEFQRWVAGISGAKPSAVEVAAAGLTLLNGKQETAQQLENVLQQDGSFPAAEGLGELGWWHYLAGEYPRRVELLSLAVQRIPDERRWRLRLAWADIEVRRYTDALGMLQSVTYAPAMESEKAMVRAVTRWRAAEKDQAMEDFVDALGNSKAEWQNPQLMKALYSPATAESIAQMNDESERRREKANAASAHDRP